MIVYLLLSCHINIFTSNFYKAVIFFGAFQMYQCIIEDLKRKSRIVSYAGKVAIITIIRK